MVVRAGAYTGFGTTRSGTAAATGPANGTVQLSADGSFTYTPNAGFVGADVFTYRANDLALDSAPATVTVTHAAPPRVQSVQINDGSDQRPLVRSITVTFDTQVTLDTGAIALLRDTGGNPTRAMRVTSVNGQAVVTFKFTGSATQSGSLADGL